MPPGLASAMLLFADEVIEQVRDRAAEVKSIALVRACHPSR